MSLYSLVDKALLRLGRSHFLTSPKVIQYMSAFCGILGSLFFLFGLVASHNVPPMAPYWTPEHTRQFWRDHLHGAQTGAALLSVSGMFYLPFTCLISQQMQRIPNLPPIIPQIQMASGAAGVWTLSGPGVLLAATIFRLEQDAQIIQAMTDLFWICTFMPWSTFMIQNFMWVWAVLSDTREKPLFPRWIAIINFIAPVCFVPAVAMHVTKTGPFAWNGVLSYWFPGAAFVLQLFIDTFTLCRAIGTDVDGGEELRMPSSQKDEPTSEGTHSPA